MTQWYRRQHSRRDVVVCARVVAGRFDGADRSLSYQHRVADGKWPPRQGRGNGEAGSQPFDA